MSSQPWATWLPPARSSTWFWPIPPYGEKNIGRRSTSLAQQLLDDPRLPMVMTDSALLVLGHTKRDTLSVPDFWEERKLLKHGDSVMRFFAPRKTAAAAG